MRSRAQGAGVVGVRAEGIGARGGRGREAEEWVQGSGARGECMQGPGQRGEGAAGWSSRLPPV